MAGREAKAARTQLALGLGVNHATLVRVLDLVRAEPNLVDEVRSRHQLHRAERKQWERVGRTLTLEKNNGQQFDWEISDFASLLNLCLETSQNFHADVESLYNRDMCVPGREWELIVYSDECTPGSVLRPINSRKCWCVYVAIKPLGKLSLDAAWLPLGTIRTDVVRDDLQGGWPACLKALLKHLFFGAGSLSAGVMIPALGKLLFFKLGALLADESGLHATWSSKGAGGLMPCFRCKNVVMKRTKGVSLLDTDTSGTLVDITCNSLERLQPQTDRDVLNNADVLAAQRHALPVGRFQALQQAMGMNYNPHGLLFDPTLRPWLKPITWTLYDPMHIFL